MRIPALLASIATIACASASAELSIRVGETGLTSVSVDGNDLLARGRGRDIRPVNWTPKILHPDGTVVTGDSKAKIARDEQLQRITQTYPWGVVTCTYTQYENQLHFELSVKNTSSDDVIQSLTLQLIEMTFASVPDGRVLDAGMFGMATGWKAVRSAPLTATPVDMPPVVFIRHDGGLIAFVSDGDAASGDTSSLSIPFTTTPATGLGYPFIVTFGAIAPGKAVNAEVSLRFAPPDTDPYYLADDVLARYRESYPPAIEWSDRRPIGALFLATSQKHPPLNPRGWFLNATDVDVTTPQGVAKWRARLMKYADDSIKILRDIDAQGMITWDVEGEEFPTATYYGDPRLAPLLAPETAVGGALDEYFAKFRKAGFRTGLTLRPQAISFKDGVPIQNPIADPSRELLEKIEYAMSQWGCTLFYIDSTYDKAGALNADIFKAIAQRYPDILLMPENENFRDFAYAAPLNSFTHHGVTGTPPSVLDVYPEAFSVLLATTTEDKMKAGRAALTESVRRGDILIVNAWYAGKHTQFVKDIYLDAAR